MRHLLIKALQIWSKLHPLLTTPEFWSGSCLLNGLCQGW